MQSETSEDSHFHVCFVKWGGRSITGSVVRVQPGHCPPCAAWRVLSAPGYSRLATPSTSGAQLLIPARKGSPEF